MRQFLVYEKNHPRASALAQNDHTYRLLALAGCTYNEDELRKWVVQVWGTEGFGFHNLGVKLDDSIEKISTIIAHGGWGLMEIIS